MDSTDSESEVESVDHDIVEVVQGVNGSNVDLVPSHSVSIMMDLCNKEMLKKLEVDDLTDMFGSCAGVRGSP